MPIHSQTQVRDLPLHSAQSDSARLDSLIARLKASGKAELLVEHLETAHAYLLGAMWEECAANLDLAVGAAASLQDQALKRESIEAVDCVRKGLQSLHRHDSHLTGHPAWRLPDHEHAATAAGLTEFFHGHDLKLGVFYPTQHVVAVFRSWEPALEGRLLLHASGLQAGDVIAVPGVEIAKFLEELKRHRGAWARLVTQFSRLLDTEATLTSNYVTWGRDGAGFVIAYSRTEADMETVSEHLKPLRPAAMHGFLTSGIRHMI